jgi:hypothetical protein
MRPLSEANPTFDVQADDIIARARLWKVAHCSGVVASDLSRWGVDPLRRRPRVAAAAAQGVQALTSCGCKLRFRHCSHINYFATPASSRLRRSKSPKYVSRSLGGDQMRLSPSIVPTRSVTICKVGNPWETAMLNRPALSIADHDQLACEGTAPRALARWPSSELGIGKLKGVISASVRRATPAALSKVPSLLRVFFLRVALVVTLELLTAAALLVAVAFNNELTWLLMLSFVAGLTLVFSAAAARIDAAGPAAGRYQSPRL